MSVLYALHLPPGALKIFFELFQFFRIFFHIFKIMDHIINTGLEILDD